MLHLIYSFNRWHIIPIVVLNYTSANTEYLLFSNPFLNMSSLTCISSYFCKTLLGDKLFQCARSASLFELDICREPKMYLEINNKITSEDIFSYFFSDVNIACNYCDSGTELGDKIPVAEQK